MFSAGLHFNVSTTSAKRIRFSWHLLHALKTEDSELSGNMVVWRPIDQLHRERRVALRSQKVGLLRTTSTANVIRRAPRPTSSRAFPLD